MVLTWSNGHTTQTQSYTVETVEPFDICPCMITSTYGTLKVMLSRTFSTYHPFISQVEHQKKKLEKNNLTPPHDLVQIVFIRYKPE